MADNAFNANTIDSPNERMSDCTDNQDAKAFTWSHVLCTKLLEAGFAGKVGAAAAVGAFDGGNKPVVFQGHYSPFFHAELVDWQKPN